MASNLTPEQDLIVRAFFTRVTQDDDLFPTNGATQRRLAGECLRLLDYAVINGKFVRTGDVGPRKLYGPDEYECSWEKDELKAREALNEANNSESTDQADSSKPTKGSALRKALLREDV